MLDNRTLCPKVAIGIRDGQNVTLPGRWWRVFPSDLKDVQFLQILEPEQRYAPAADHGEGLFVADSVIQKL